MKDTFEGSPGAFGSESKERIVSLEKVGSVSEFEEQKCYVTQVAFPHSSPLSFQRPSCV